VPAPSRATTRRLGRFLSSLFQQELHELLPQSRTCTFEKLCQEVDLRMSPCGQRTLAGGRSPPFLFVMQNICSLDAPRVFFRQSRSSPASEVRPIAHVVAISAL
jgi:hypothetical protein